MIDVKDYQEWMDFAASIGLLERELVGAALTGYPYSFSVLRRIEFDGSIIIQDDLRLIFMAAFTQESLRPRGDLVSALILAREGLKYFKQWDGWSDELLVDLAHEDDPTMLEEIASALAKLHLDWGDRAWWDGPKFIPPPALGQLNPIRIGLALQRTANFSGIPLPWLHAEFTRLCLKRDIGLLPHRASSPIGENGGQKRSQKGVA